MKFVILDVYPSHNHRLIKDTAGGYGTGNNFGKTFFSKILNFYVDKNIGMPTIETMYVTSILKKNNEVYYTRDLNDAKINDCDYIILPTSIIAHETEIEAINHHKDKKILVIGIFANTLKEKYKKSNTVIIKNESDIFFYNLENNNKLNRDFIDQIFINENIINEFYTSVELDELPFPDWGNYIERFPLRNNFFALNQKIAIPILGTRGCPYSCFHYCTYPLQQGRKVRARSVKNIVEEIVYWKKTLNTNKFVFRDPVFSINKKHTVNLCKEIIEKKLNIKFMVETHLNNLDDEMINLLSKAGLELVYVGIESADGFVLEDMKRFTIQNDKQYEIIKKCEDAGIKVKTMFIIGNPEDNEETIKKTINYSTYLPSLYAQYSVFTPYPGTPVFKEFESIIKETKLENFNQYTLTFHHKYLNSKEIEKLKSLAYFRFYFNFKRIIKILLYLMKSKYA
jgi:anaerobic magnesium-protoporphyrin IX monomethyl ester cyclase